MSDDTIVLQSRAVFDLIKQVQTLTTERDAALAEAARLREDYEAVMRSRDALLALHDEMVAEVKRLSHFESEEYDEWIGEMIEQRAETRVNEASHEAWRLREAMDAIIDSEPASANGEATPGPASWSRRSAPRAAISATLSNAPSRRSPGRCTYTAPSRSRWSMSKPSPSYCPACRAVFQYEIKGKRYSRAIAIVDRDKDRMTHWLCPDCEHEWEP